MKLAAIGLAAAATLGSLIATPVLAQRHVEVTRTVVTDHRVGPAPHRGWRNHNRHCTTRWYHHRRVTRCW